MNFIKYDDYFDHIEGDDTSYVFQIFPKTFRDNRGSFTEVLKDCGQSSKDDILQWFSSMGWMQQINRSSSIPNVCRGMHAQKGIFCQSKLVECISGYIYDIIIDARPNSKTYGRVKTYALDSEKANKLFAPKGFLHGYFSASEMPNGTPIKENIFQYYIGGGTYSHENEFSVSISDTLNGLRNSIENYWLPNDEDIILSDKDKDGFPIEKWLSDTMEEYKKSGNLWYK